MRTLTSAILGVACMAGLQAAVCAQTLNRAIHGIVISHGSMPELYDIAADVSITVFSADADLDFGGAYHTLLNDSDLGPAILRSGTAPAALNCSGTPGNCSGSCTPVSWEGVTYQGTCTTKNGACGCDYGRRKSLASDVPLLPGDTITVFVVPLPGAEPELLTSDDTLTVIFQPSVFTPYCFGDGSGAPCPCSNPGAPGRGCDNAQGTGGVELSASGNPADNSVVLLGSGFSSQTAPTVVVIRSPGLESPPAPFGDGLRCIALAGFVRVGATTAANGSSAHPLNHGAGPGLWFYELWYRNNPGSFCTPAAFNLSNGLSVLWP